MSSRKQRRRRKKFSDLLDRAELELDNIELELNRQALKLAKKRKPFYRI